MDNNLGNADNRDHEQLKKICEDLQREYDLTADRRKTLTNQATSLMGFGAIVETILIALIVSLATDADVKDTVARLPMHYRTIVGTATIGFLAYMGATILALISYWESKWKPAPTIPDLPNRSSNEILRYFLNNPQTYRLHTVAWQLKDGTDYNSEINRKKFKYLAWATLLLVVGIGMTAVAGITLLSSL